MLNFICTFICIYNFYSEHLVNVAISAILDVRRADEGLNMTRQRAVRFANSDRRVREAQEMLASRRLLRMEFLSRVSHISDSIINYQARFLDYNSYDGDNNGNLQDLVLPEINNDNQPNVEIHNGVHASSDNEIENDNNNTVASCAVCYAHVRVAWQCGHCFCEQCSTQLLSAANKRCAVCRVQYNFHIQLFV